MLTEGQLLVVGFIATILMQIIALVYTKRKGKKPSKLAYSIIAFVVALALAYAFGAPKIVLSTDPMAAATQLLEAAVGVVGLATLFYNALLSKFFELSGIMDTGRMIARAVIPSSDASVLAKDN